MPRRARRRPTPLAAARSAADPLDGPSGSLTLPDGRRLHVQTVSQAKGRDEGIKAADDAARKEGRDLGGWTGGLVWESGEILARTLMSCRELVVGQRCLELGTGCGLVGLTAGALGAAEAYLTDNVTFMAEANLQANFGGDAEALARIRTVRLRWGDDADVRDCLTSGPFDLLLGSDILYHKESYVDLANTLDALSRPGTVVLWATPDGAPE